ncbi:hypothetical protein PRIPAC_81969 [Pristionchus pacificus]|uniref:Uncharacterized protein n=1 Tax=Pristionchus pacificus TaxID=54126 RepID=A0A2A6BY40_PRIPA|nr:hypothetical protein PRIPAC_81969 [Pristionchus pacificus]|eukprot:PDM70825.1 hypothetical protein PRIPAC_45029 [Pristionchus pacificus]
MKLFSLLYICLAFAIISVAMAAPAGFIDDCRGKGDIKEGMKRSAEYGTDCKPATEIVEPLP